MARLNFHSDFLKKKKKEKVKQIIAKVTTCLHIVLEFMGLAEASDTESLLWLQFTPSILHTARTSYGRTHTKQEKA